MAVNKEIFNKEIFNNNIFNKEVFNNQIFNKEPFLKDAFLKEAFLKDAFDTTPFDINAFNKNISTVKEVAQSRLPLQVYPVTLESLRYRRARRNYLLKQSQQEKSTLVDTKKGTEINSLRDAVLGMFNPHMDHAIDAIPEWLGLLNVIPDTLKHWYDHGIKPIAKGRPMHALINILIAAGESLDALANPVKAVAQGIVYGDNIWENLVASTVGTEEGIKNFDWDTGYGLLNLGLEFISDPLNWGSFGAKKIAELGLIKAPLKLTKEAMEAAGKKATKDVAKEVSGILGKGVRKVKLNHIDAVAAGTKKLTREFNDTLFKTDAYKGYMKQLKAGELKGFKAKVEGAKDLLRINTWDEVQERFSKAYTKGYVEHIAKVYNIDPKKGRALLDQLEKTIGDSAMTKTIVDLNRANWDNMTKSVLVSLGARGNVIDDLYSKTIFKLELTPTIAYPIHYALKYSDIGHLPAVQKSLAGLKLAIQRVDRNVTDNFLALSKKPGTILKSTTKVDLEIEKKPIIDSLFNENITVHDVQEKASLLSAEYAAFIEKAKRILDDPKLTMTAQEEQILKAYQASLSPEVSSLQDMVNLVDETSNRLTELGLPQTAQDSFQQYKDEFIRLKEHIEAHKTLEKADSFLKENQEVVAEAETLTDVFDNNKQFSAPYLEKAAKHVQLQADLDILTQEITDLDLHLRSIEIEDPNPMFEEAITNTVANGNLNKIEVHYRDLSKQVHALFKYLEAHSELTNLEKRNIIIETFQKLESGLYSIGDIETFFRTKGKHLDKNTQLGLMEIVSRFLGDNPLNEKEDVIKTFVKNLKETDELTQAAVLKEMQNVVAHVKNTNDVLKYMTVFSEKYITDFYGATLRTRELSKAIEDIIEQLDWEDFTNKYQKGFENVLIVLKKLSDSLEKEERKPLKALIKSIKKLTNLTIEDSYTYNRSLKKVRAVLRTLQGQIKRRRIYKNALPKELTQLIKTNPKVFENLLRVLRSEDPYRSDVLNNAYRLINKQKQMLRLKDIAQAKIEAIDLNTPLKADLKLVEEIAQLLHIYSKHFIKGDITQAASKEQVKKGVKAAAKLYHKMEKQFGGFGEAINQYQDFLEHLQVPLIDERGNMRPIAKEFTELHESLYEVFKHLEAFTQGEVPESAYNAWYLELYDIVQKTSIKYEKFEKQFEKNVDPEVLAEYNTAYTLKHFGKFLEMDPDIKRARDLEIAESATEKFLAKADYQHSKKLENLTPGDLYKEIYSGGTADHDPILGPWVKELQDNLVEAYSNMRKYAATEESQKYYEIWEDTYNAYEKHTKINPKIPSLTKAQIEHRYALLKTAKAAGQNAAPPKHYTVNDLLRDLKRSANRARKDMLANMGDNAAVKNWMQKSKNYSDALKLKKQLSKKEFDLKTFVQNILNCVNFSYQSTQSTINSTENILSQIKLSEEQASAMINSMNWIRAFRRDEVWQDLTGSIKDFPEQLTKYKPVEQVFLLFTKAIEEGNANESIFRRNIRYATAHIPDSVKRTQVENAIWSAVHKLKRTDLTTTNANNITNSIIDSTEGYVRALNMNYSSRSLDVLRKDYGLVTDTQDLILEEMKKAGIRTDGGAHSALYDAVTTLMINEKEAGGRLLPATEYVYDIETTGGLDKFGKPVGDVLEAAIIRRNEEGVLEVILDSKVQATSEEVTLRYANPTNVLRNMDITLEEQHAKYATTDPSKFKSSEEVLQDVYMKLLEIVNNAEDKPIIHDYNGIKFDREYLLYSMLANSIGGNLTETSKQRLVKGKVLKQLQLEKYPTVREVMEKIEWVDDLAEKNKDLYSVDPFTRDNILHAVTDLYNRQSKVFEYNNIKNANGDQIIKIPTTLLTEFDGSFITVLKDATAEDPIPAFKLKDAVEKIAIEYNNLEDTISAEKSLVLNAEYTTDYSAAAEALEDVLGKTDELGLDVTIQNYMKNVVREAIDTFRSIGQINRHYSDMLIVEALYNPRNPNFNVKLYQEFTDALIKVYEKYGFNATELKIAKDNNLTKILNQLQIAGAYKNYRPELLELIDITAFYKDGNLENSTRITLDSYLRALQEEQNHIVNLDVVKNFSKETNEVLTILKESKINNETTSVLVTEYNARQNYAQLQVLWERLNRLATQKAYNSKKAKNIIDTIREEHKELADALDARLAHISLNYKNESAIWDYAEKVSEDIIDYQEVATMQYSVEKLDRELNLFSRKINTRLTRAAHKLNDLYKKSFNKNHKGTKLTAQYKADGRAFTEAMYLHSTYNKLTASADDLIADLLYNTTNRTMTIYRPHVDNVFHTHELFDNMVQRASELKEQGVILKYDETNKAIVLTLDSDLTIARSSNYHSRHLWTVDGREIQQAEYPALSKDIFEKFYSDVNLNPEYKQALYDLYLETASVNKSFAGRTGITKYIDDFKVVYEDSGKLNFKDYSKLDETMPYYDEDYIGAYNDISKIVGGRRSDALHTLNEIAHKTGNHTHQSQQYAEFILNSGFNLNDDILQDISLEDLSSYLNKNPDMVVVYFRNDKHAINGMVLDVLGTVNPESLKSVKDLGATILPWNIYTEAAGTFNQFAYNNRYVEYWYKLMQLYKKAWLMTPGSILRNAMDSNMKSMFEGGEVNNTIKSFSDAHKVLTEYDDITRKIKNLDPNGRFRVGNIDEYFKYAKGNLDREAYLYLYQVMNNMGMNSMNTMIDGIFGAFMRPMAAIERTARLSMYLNLEGQGLRYSEIMRRITETHFNYDISTSLGYLKALIPFHTYTFSNLNYIMHLLEENPAVLRHFLEIYQTVWNTQGFDHDELEDNVSLQYQLINGNIPLSFFGFKDKEIQRMVDTKYGPQLQTVKNNVVIKMGSSILDGLNMIVNPVQSFKDKLAPPVQVIMDTATRYLESATGNFTRNTWYNFEDATAKYNEMLGDVSLQSLITDPSKVIDLLPVAGPIKQRFFHKEGDQYKFGSTTGQRTQSPVLDVLGMTGIVGATSRWGDFAQRPRQNTRRTPATYSYTNRYARRNLYNYKRTHSNYYHRVPANIKTIPQYLFSNMGRTSRGKSKTMMWLNMNTRNRVKFMTKRYAGVNSFYR